MKCSICGTQIAAVDEAIEEGWVPYFYRRHREREFSSLTSSQAILRVEDCQQIAVKDGLQRDFNSARCL
jgi:hypothetical protein